MLKYIKDRNLPHLSPLPKRHWWIVRSNWFIYDFKIPKGFACDLDSIPHVPILFALFKGRARKAALLHDYLYATGEVSRTLADRYFYQLMLEEDVNKLFAKSMYFTVRMFGARFYLNDYNDQKYDSVKERCEKYMMDNSGNVPLFDEERLKDG